MGSIWIPAFAGKVGFVEAEWRQLAPLWRHWDCRSQRNLAYVAPSRAQRNIEVFVGWLDSFRGKPVNTDGGPKTALFSFDRDRERQMAERYTKGSPEWLEARFVLIDEVLAYRQTGRLTQSLLDACEAELHVASFAYSQGVQRLAELANDGHAEATSRLERMTYSSNWKIRYEALRTWLNTTRSEELKRELVRKGLKDKSGSIRRKISSEASFLHLIDMIADIENAAASEINAKYGREIYFYAYEMRRNHISGRRGAIGGDAETRAAFDLAWQAFVADRRLRQVE
ncbi:MAG: hypothetical protein ACOVOE_07405 [Caulobacter sp.]